MSLDVYLYGVLETKCPNCGHVIESTNEEVYWANITHNLNIMAGEAGIYQHMWRPEELGLTKAGELIEPLEEGLRKLKDDPQHFEQFNPNNGWGSYEGLCEFVAKYLEACKEYPNATIRISR